MSTGNSYLDSIDSNKPKDVSSKATIEQNVGKGLLELGKEIIIQNVSYFNVKLAEMTLKGSGQTTVTREELEMMVKNANEYLKGFKYP